MNSIQTPDTTDPGWIGTGLSWTPRISGDLLARLDEIDCVEIIAENFFFHGDAVLEELKRAGKPVLVHSVELSLGTEGTVKLAHLDRIKEVAAKVEAVNFSDHIGFCEHGPVETIQPAILPFTADAADVVCRNIETLQRHLDKPFLIENEANRYLFPYAEMSEPAFFNRIISSTGCGLLLDLTNLHTNAVNFGIDPKAWLDEIRLDAVAGLHLAGGSPDPDGMLQDSHDRDVPDEVWDLLEYIAAEIHPVSVILERHGNEPEFQNLLDQLTRAKGILANRGGVPEVHVTEDVHVLR